MFGEKNAVELVFLAALALIVIGPNDLPRVLRQVGQFTAKMRGLAAEFRASFEELARQSELDELRKEVEALRKGQLGMADHQVEIEREFDQLQHSMNLLPGEGSYPAPLSVERDYSSVEADEDQPDLPFHAAPVSAEDETASLFDMPHAGLGAGSPIESVVSDTGETADRVPQDAHA